MCAGVMGILKIWLRAHLDTYQEDDTNDYITIHDKYSSTLIYKICAVNMI